jgi:hypothetical protein
LIPIIRIYYYLISESYSFTQGIEKNLYYNNIVSRSLDEMVKGGRSYIPVSRDNNSYKVYVADVKTWHLITKKKTPRLPKYY